VATILVVDDDSLVRSSIVECFSAAGYQTLAAVHGAEALAILEDKLPDLVISDIDMPVMDGFEVLRWIRQHESLSGLRVLVLTVSNRISDVNLAYELGANSFLVKPTDFEQTVHLSSLIKDYWLGADAGPTVSRPSNSKQRAGEKQETRN